MEYKQFKDVRLSALGFGTMRYPLNEDKSINTELAEELIKTAYKNGINWRELCEKRNKISKA